MLCNDTDPRMVLLSLPPSPFVMPDDALPVSETAFSPNRPTVMQKSAPLCLSSLGHSEDTVCAVCPRCSPCCACGENDVSEGSSGDDRKVSTDMFRKALTKTGTLDGTLAQNCEDNCSGASLSANGSYLSRESEVK